MEWSLFVYVDGRHLRLKAEIFYQSDQIMRIRVTGRNKALTLQNNQPLLLAKGLKNKRVHWSLIEGTIHNAYVLSKIIDELDRFIKRKARDEFKL